MGELMTGDAYWWLAKCYDTVLEPALGSARSRAMKLWPPMAGQMVLDVGCGTGTQLLLYLRAGCRVMGIDPSPAMARRARIKLGVETLVVLGDATQMPCASASFDWVLMSLMLHELPESVRGGILRETKRVLKSTGRVVVFEYHPGPLHFPRGWLAKPLIELAERIAGREHFREYRRFLAGGGLPTLAARHGFEAKAARIIKGGNFGLFLLRDRNSQD